MEKDARIRIPSILHYLSIEIRRDLDMSLVAGAIGSVFAIVGFTYAAFCMWLQLPLSWQNAPASFILSLIALIASIAGIACMLFVLWFVREDAIRALDRARRQREMAIRFMAPKPKDMIHT